MSIVEAGVVTLPDTASLAPSPNTQYLMIVAAVMMRENINGITTICKYDFRRTHIIKKEKMRRKRLKRL